LLLSECFIVVYFVIDSVRELLDTTSYVFKVWYLVKHTDNSTFAFSSLFRWYDADDSFALSLYWNTVHKTSVYSSLPAAIQNYVCWIEYIQCTLAVVCNY